MTAITRCTLAPRMGEMTEQPSPEQATRPYGIVYLARNTANGKGYVGQTVRTLKRRSRNHHSDAKRGSRTPFHRAIRKHEAGKFRWQVLTACDGRDALDAAERAYIDILKTKAPRGYNLTNGGDGHSGLNPSAGTRQKMSESGKGHPCSAETRQKMSEAHKGKVVSVATRRKLSEFHMGSTNCKGRVHSAETRLKISEGLKRYQKSIPSVPRDTAILMTVALGAEGQDYICGTQTK